MQTDCLNTMRADNPLMVAKYVTSLDHKINSNLEKAYSRWARHFLRKLRRVTRRLEKVFHSQESQPIGRRPRASKTRVLIKGNPGRKNMG